MRWVYYGVALAATALACVLWLFVFGVLPRASSVPAPAVTGATVVSASLPVPAVLRPAVAGSVPDSSSERFFCLAGFVARQTGNSVETLLVDNQPVPCAHRR
jgi:hypothetical protein